MGSIRIVYDMEGDMLDVDFRLTGEKPQKGIELHPNVTLWTDINQRTPVRLLLLSYAQLLEQPELSFDTLKQLPSQGQTEVVKLLTRAPLKCLLTCLDEKDASFPGYRTKSKRTDRRPHEAERFGIAFVSSRPSLLFETRPTQAGQKGINLLSQKSERIPSIKAQRRLAPPLQGGGP